MIVFVLCAMMVKALQCTSARHFGNAIAQGHHPMKNPN